MMLLTLVILVILLVNVVLEENSTNVPFVTMDITYSMVNVELSVLMVTMLTKQEVPVKDVLDLAEPVPVHTTTNVSIVTTLMNIYITTLVINLVQEQLITKKSQKKLVRTVTKDVLSVLTKLTLDVLNVTIHGSSSETTV
jgi:hypothetical protein